MVKPLYQKGWRVFNFHFSLQYDEKVKEEKFEELLKEKVPAQKLSIESGLTKIGRAHV